MTTPSINRSRSRRAVPVPMTLDLTVARRVNLLTVGGDLDLRSHTRLTRVLERLEATHRPLVVALDQVTSADTHGVMPLVEAAARRVALGLPELQFHEPAPCVTRVLDQLASV